MSSRSTNPASDFQGPLTEVVPVSPESAETDAQMAAASRLADEMADSWRTGERPCADVFLHRQPDLWGNREAAFRIICEEVCLRQEFNLPVDPRDFLGRFPQWHTELLALLDCHRLLQETAAEDPGALKDFELLSELGRGAQGKVYLAKQRSLGDRPVVLKITPCHGREHLSLARLQHTHIVPLYGAHDNVLADQRVLCMPYFG